MTDPNSRGFGSEGLRQSAAEHLKGRRLPLGGPEEVEKILVRMCRREKRVTQGDLYLTFGFYSVHNEPGSREVS